MVPCLYEKEREANGPRELKYRKEAVKMRVEGEEVEKRREAIAGFMSPGRPVNV